jgi:NTE family protein
MTTVRDRSTTGARGAGHDTTTVLDGTAEAAAQARRPPGQVVLVLQGGGALGAYQVGVYEAMHEAGIEPDWVIGTSIGAINAALIAGNAREHRLERMRQFWELVTWRSPFAAAGLSAQLVNPLAGASMITQGVQGFFQPNPSAWLGVHAPLGVEHAAWYSTAPLARTLHELVDFERINGGPLRLTVGAVNARTGEMRYFDSRNEAICAEHVMASGALPPAFPAVRVDGEPYWDGGIYSNTPIEAVFDDVPRRSSTVFAVHLWNPSGSEPESIWQVMGRQKEIQYQSRARSHVQRQKQIHHLRHLIGDLVRRLPADERDHADVRRIATYGCRTTMHVVRLLAPRLEHEDHTKDIDFTPGGIEQRRYSGHADMREALAAAPWSVAHSSEEGVVIHEVQSTRTM